MYKFLDKCSGELIFFINILQDGINYDVDGKEHYLKELDDKYIGSNSKELFDGIKLVMEATLGGAGDITFFVSNPSNLYVDFGDGTVSEITSSGYFTHSYTGAGAYDVKFVGGTASKIQFGTDDLVQNTPTVWTAVKSKVSKNLGLISADKMFNQCSNISSWTANFFDEASSNITDFNRIVRQIATFNEDITGWNTRNGVDFNRAFSGCSVFNQPIGNWNMSSAQDLQGMFWLCTNFNQSLTNWDTSNVTNMTSMFRQSGFNGEVNGWDTSNVTNMSYMFTLNSVFNQPVDNWDVSNVTVFSLMFYLATSFNQDISSWRATNGSDATYLLFGASSFNKPITNFVQGTSMSIEGLLRDCTNFNQSISGWNTSGITNFKQVFYQTSFNQPVDMLDTQSAVDMTAMFFGCSNFNQDVSSWNVSTVDSLNGTFNTTSFNQDLGGWTPVALTNADVILDNTPAFTTEKYDSLLIGWGSLSASLEPNVLLGVGSTKYSLSASTYRDALSAIGWTITDGGQV